MPGVEVSQAEFGRRLTEAQRAQVARDLSEGRGVALYSDARGAGIVVMTWGARDADVPGPCPAAYGGGSLDSYVPAQKSARPMVSPALMNRDVVPQITAPRRSRSWTERPEVQIEMRQGTSHPRDGYINPQRLLPGRQPEEPPAPAPAPAEPLSEGQAWFRDHLR